MDVKTETVLNIAMSRIVEGQLRELRERLPQPPRSASIRTTNVWIVEWLPEADRCTGQELHDWMTGQRRGWSYFTRCHDKEEVIAAIETAEENAKSASFRPVLHIEAHGDTSTQGLIGPGAALGWDLLSWRELTSPLQRLNIATGCNLVMVVAACTGFAGIQALVEGPRAPAVALVGTDAELSAMELFQGTKELYRRWMDAHANLDDASLSASRELGSANFVVEPFCLMAYESLLDDLISKATDGRLPAASDLQHIWDEMFMMDIDPANHERFGLNWSSIVQQIAETTAC